MEQRRPGKSLFSRKALHSGGRALQALVLGLLLLFIQTTWSPVTAEDPGSQQSQKLSVHQPVTVAPPAIQSLPNGAPAPKSRVLSEPWKCSDSIPQEQVEAAIAYFSGKLATLVITVCGLVAVCFSLRIFLSKDKKYWKKIAILWTLVSVSGWSLLVLLQTFFDNSGVH